MTEAKKPDLLTRLKVYVDEDTAERGYVYFHQKVDVEVDLLNQILKGYTEIFIKPLRFDIDVIRLYCRQFIVNEIKINNHSAKFDINGSDDAGIFGEIIVHIPDEITDFPLINNDGEWVPIVVRVEYTLEKPKAGVHFKLPDNDKEIFKPQWDPYMFTINSPTPGAARCWVPCLDRIRDRCTWDFFITVSDVEGFDKIMVACSGNLVKLSESSTDSHKRTFHYNLPVATPAQYIGFACGPFIEPYVLDYPGSEEGPPPNRPKILAYISAEWEKWLLSTLYPNADEPTADTYWLHNAMEYFIEGYSQFNLHPEFDKNNPPVRPGTFPFQRFQIVFVDHTYSDVNYVIDQRVTTRRSLITAIAQQWFGIFIPPYSWRDYWLAVGLSNFFANMYFERLFGEDDTKFLRKKDIELVCQLDVGKPPLCSMDFTIPFESKDLEFISLKSYLVLWMLDKRLPFLDYRRGIPGIIYLILNKSKEDVEQNIRPGFLYTEQFLEQCKDVIRQELRSEITKFQKQWIYGSGCPKFKIRAHFNRKKLAVEFRFDQENTNRIEKDSSRPTNTPLFTGHMDIAIKEPDGGKLVAHAPSYLNDDDPREYPLQWGMDPDSESSDLAEWQISEWVEEEKASIARDSWEWIRVDDSFSWVADIDFEQLDYMWAALLDSQRDIIAHYEAVRALSKNPSKACSTTLMRTVRDWRYYYRIRMEAAIAMAKCANEELDFIGSEQLMKIYENDYCDYRDEAKFLPKPNDFNDWEEYYVQKTIPFALSCVRGAMGNAPDNIKKFLLDLLSWNDNSKNEYSDDHFVANLIESLGNAFIIPFDGQSPNNPNVETFDLYCESLAYSQEVLETLDRYLTRHKLFNSYRALLVVATIKTKNCLMLSQIIPADGRELLLQSQYGNYVGVRVAALSALIDLEFHHKPEIAQYFTFLAEYDSDLMVRRFLISKFGEDRGPQCWDLPKRNAPLRLLRVHYRRSIPGNFNHTNEITRVKPDVSVLTGIVNENKGTSAIQEAGSDVEVHENGEDMPLALRGHQSKLKKKSSPPSNQNIISDAHLSEVKNVVELKNADSDDEIEVEIDIPETRTRRSSKLKKATIKETKHKKRGSITETSAAYQTGVDSEGRKKAKVNKVKKSDGHSEKHKKIKL
ncbi:4258_t:CDS:10, partial [Acaulospora morrowiae]